MWLSLSVNSCQSSISKWCKHLNSCSTFRFESGVTSCNLHITVHTSQKLSAVFMTYFLGLHCYPKKCLLATSLLTSFQEFSLFLFAPYTNIFCFFSSEYCSDNSKKHSAVNWNFQMNFENSAFFSLSFGTVSMIISIHAAQVFTQSLKRIHYSLKTHTVFRNWQLRDWVQVLNSRKSLCNAWS